MLKKNRGEGKFGLIVILVIVAAGLYVGFKWGAATINANKFRDSVNQSIVYWSSHGAPAQENIAIEILQKAKENNVDLYGEDIEIEMNGKFMSINIYWETPLTFPGGKTYYLPFTIEREFPIN